MQENKPIEENGGIDEILINLIYSSRKHKSSDKPYNEARDRIEKLVADIINNSGVNTTAVSSRALELVVSTVEDLKEDQYKRAQSHGLNIGKDK
jgi:hypothetical protein